MSDKDVPYSSTYTNGPQNQKSGEPEDFKKAGRSPQRMEEVFRSRSRPPHSIEAEQGILGCVLLSPTESLAQSESYFKGRASEAFYDLRHQLIYGSMVALDAKLTVVDTIALVDHLRRRGQLDCVGGLSYIASLPDATPSAANLNHYLGIVSELYGLRKVIAICTEYVETANEFVPDVNEFMDGFERDVFALLQFRQNHKREGTAANFMRQHEERLEQGWNKQSGSLFTGFEELDRLLGGMERGEVIVIGAAPSVGKTALAANILSHQLRQRIPCAFFSLEMQGERIAARLASEESGVPLKRARREEFQHDEDFQKYSRAAKTISTWPLWIVDESAQTIAQIRARCRRFKSQHSIALAAVDYIQLVEAGVRANTRNDSITHISRNLKAMAMELQIAVVVLAQLSREHRKANRLPSLYDLRESGAIEADADKVILLHPADSGVKVLVEKNRNEARGNCKLGFDAPIFRFFTPQEDPGL